MRADLNRPIPGGLVLNSYEQGENLARQIKRTLLDLLATKSVSKAELARRIGVSTTYLAPLWADSPEVSLKKVAQACVALGERPDAILAQTFTPREVVGVTV